jgi:hypothetical protein
MMRWWQVLSFVPLALAARLRHLERRTILRVTDAGANTAERAVLLEQSGKLGEFVHRRLEHANVLISAGNDRYYFSRVAYDAFRRRRRRRAIVVLALLLIGIAVMYFRGDLS